MTLCAARPISFIIPVRDDAQRLMRCLESIRRNDYPSDLVEVVVVDNGSRDDSAAVSRGHGAKVLEIPDRPVGELRNVGAQSSKGEILAFVDADHEIDPGWIRAAVEALEDRSVGAAGDLCMAPPDGTWVQLAYDSLRARNTGSRDVNWLGTGNLAVRRAVFQDLGGFDTGLETCEDVDLCFRIRAAGYRIVSDDRLRNLHVGDPRTLRQLFVGELWRGRDNLRVSLRYRLSLRDLPSILIPLVDLGCLAILVAGLLSFQRIGLEFSAVAAAVILGLAGLRCARMMVRSGIRRPLRLTQAFALSCVYDLGRALALVLRRRHHRVRRTRASHS